MDYTKHYQSFKAFFAVNVNFHRTDQSMTIEDLAIKSGLPEQLIELLEQGVADLDFDDFFRISCALKIHPFRLLENIYVDDPDDNIKPISIFSIDRTLSLPKKEKSEVPKPDETDVLTKKDKTGFFGFFNRS